MEMPGRMPQTSHASEASCASAGRNRVVTQAVNLDCGDLTGVAGWVTRSPVHGRH